MAITQHGGVSLFDLAASGMAQVPTGAQVGDLMLVQSSCFDQTAGFATRTLSEWKPIGWGNTGGYGWLTSATDRSYTFGFYKILTETDISAGMIGPFGARLSDDTIQIGGTLIDSALLRGHDSFPAAQGGSGTTTDGQPFIRWYAYGMSYDDMCLVRYGISQGSPGPSHWPTVFPSGTEKIVLTGQLLSGFCIEDRPTAGEAPEKSAPIPVAATSTTPAYSAYIGLLVKPVLKDLIPTPDAFPHNAKAGAVIATIPRTFGSTLSLTVSDTKGEIGLNTTTGELYMLSDCTYVAGDEVYLTIVETKAGISNSPKTSSISMGVYQGWSGAKWEAVGSPGVSTSSIVVSPPPGTSEGQLMILFTETANQAVTAPAGWSPCPWPTSGQIGVGTAASTTATRLSAFYKFASSSEGPVVVADPGDHALGIIHTFSNVDPINPFGPYNPTTQATTSTSVSFGSLTTTDPNYLLVAAVSVATDLTSPRVNSWAGGLTERSDNATNAGNGGGLGVATKELATAGNTGTLSATLATSSLQAKILFTLVPPSGEEPEIQGKAEYTSPLLQ